MGIDRTAHALRSPQEDTGMTRIQPISAAQTVSVRPSTAAMSADALRSANPTQFLGAPRKSVKDMSARERFETLHQRFNKKAAKGVNVSFQFDLSGSGGGKWFVTIKGGKLTVKEGAGANPTATLRASASDYLKIANGEMNKMFAFIRGKLKVEGDKDELKKFDSYFES